LCAPPVWAQSDHPPENFTIAFIGDQGLGPNALAVLSLIRDEGADAVIHAGDFDYEQNPAAWDAQINDVLGADFAYFACAGNHDEGKFEVPGGYQDFLEERMNRLEIPWQGELGVQSSFYYQGVFVVLTAPGIFTRPRPHESYIRDELAVDDSVWRISSWHKNMSPMQVGGKTDETGWGVYEESRAGGAIIATAHEHSYSRTHLLSSCESQTVASRDSTLVLSRDDLGTITDEGRSFVFVSGLGGRSIRNQDRFSDDWWASIYASDQNANHGALFGVFNYQGNPRLAHFYFKDIDGNIPDDFFVESTLGSEGGPACGDGVVDRDEDCDDGDICNGAEVCRSGSCLAGTPLDCSDGDPCTEDLCDSRLGCLNAVIPSCLGCTDDSECDNANACDGLERCIAGGCRPGSPLDCDDGNHCTDDSCDPGSGCVYAPNDVPCDDGDPCTIDDACQDSRCKGSPETCGDGTVQESCGEECEADPDCGAGAYCGDFCLCERPAGPLCGNGLLEAGEECEEESHCTRDEQCDAFCMCEPAERPGRVQSKAQRKCITALNKRLARVTKAQAKHIRKCIKRGAKGELEGGLAPIEECIYATDTFGKDKVARSRAKTLAKAACRCSETPDFGPMDAASVNQGAVVGALGLFHDLFGPNLDASIVSRDSDERGAKCQYKVARRVRKCQYAKLKSFYKCKKYGLKGGKLEKLYPGADDPFDSPDDLESCMDFDLVPKAKDRVQRACDEKLQEKIDEKCTSVNYAVLFPGVCKGATDPVALKECIDELVECRVCLALNEVDGLKNDCDLFDDGQANGSCQ
jgi:hypothetical protein